LWREVKEYIGAIRKFPERMREVVVDLLKPQRAQKIQHLSALKENKDWEVSL